MSISIFTILFDTFYLLKLIVYKMLIFNFLVHGTIFFIPSSSCRTSQLAVRRPLAALRSPPAAYHNTIITLYHIAKIPKKATFS